MLGGKGLKQQSLETKSLEAEDGSIEIWSVSHIPPKQGMLKCFHIYLEN